MDWSSDTGWLGRGGGEGGVGRGGGWRGDFPPLWKAATVSAARARWTPRSAVCGIRRNTSQCCTYPSAAVENPACFLVGNAST